MAARNFVAWVYTDDNGQDYVRRADVSLTLQQGDNNPLIALGGSDGSVLVPPTEMPRNLKPRKVYGRDGGGYRGSAVVYTASALLAIVPNQTTFIVHDAGGTPHTCVVKSKVGEPPHGTIQ